MTTIISNLPQRKAFSSDNLQFAWDSVSLGAAKKCPRYYLYSILQGWQPKMQSPHLTFGIVFHSAMEALDHIRVTRPLVDSDLYPVIRQAMKTLGSYDENGIFTPWRSGHDKKNLESMIRSIVWYFDEYLNDTYTVIQLANGRAAVELSFRFPLGLKHAGEDLLYCGHLDSLGEFAQSTYGLDRKTTGGALTQQFYSQFSPSVQITGYNLASRLVYNVASRGIIIDAMQIGAGFVRFGRQIVANTEAQLEEWLTSSMYTIQDSQRWLDQQYWPMNETACNLYMGCTYRGICSKDPSVRERFLEADFHTRAWDPLEPRGTDA
ncbi:MAG: hypothetical protein B7Z37_02985 [Verrucomicrobia bacterium 12-59-8]|nr:MAG: hypothetical protein B7Z37_02985 [Verrucomicrobia bacterium 12-59-8]